MNRRNRPVLSELGVTVVMHIKNCHVDRRHKVHHHEPLGEVLADKVVWDHRLVWPQNRASKQSAFYPVTL